MRLNELPAHKIHKMLVSKEITAEEVTKAVIEKIENTDKRINAYVTKTYDLALKEAKLVDEKMRKGEKINYF